MKYCPTCDTRYDEDILRFCMKDGTPLLEEAEPNFVEMPSESLDVAAEVDPDDPSEHTVIRRNIPVPPPVSEVEQPPPPPSIEEDFSDVRPNSGGQRIVVPTLEEQQRERARIAAQYQAQPRRSGVNTALVVLVTIFGTIIVVGLGGIILYFLVANGSDSNTNTNVNVNANQDINANTNLGANANFDFNTNSSQTNTNTNVNINANVSTPSPTPTPSATPRPSESPSPTPDDDESPTPVPSRTPIPTPSPIVIRPGTSPSPLRTPRTVITPRPSP